MSRTLRIVPMVAALALAACGDDGGSAGIDALQVDALPPDAAPRQTIMENMLLAPGDIVEGIMTGGAGDVAHILLTAPVSELDWNIHGHANGSTQVIFEELNKLSVDYVFAPTATADWYLLFRNSGPTDMMVAMKVELFGDMQWRFQ